MANTPNYNLYVEGNDQTNFIDWRNEVAGHTNSNMHKIDDALQSLDDTISAYPPAADIMTTPGGAVVNLGNQSASGPHVILINDDPLDANDIAFDNTSSGSTATTVQEAIDQALGSGKRVCRFIIGTSTSGWTKNDCDYLCDGTNDKTVFETALRDLPASGGEIVFLDGEYEFPYQNGNMIDPVNIVCKNDSQNILIRGNGFSTIIKNSYIYVNQVDYNDCNISIQDICFEECNIETYASFKMSGCSLKDTRLSCFNDDQYNCVIINGNYIEIPQSSQYAGKTGSLIYINGTSDNIHSVIFSNNTLVSYLDSGTYMSGILAFNALIVGNIITGNFDNAMSLNTSNAISNYCYNSDVELTEKAIFSSNKIINGNVYGRGLGADGGTISNNYIDGGYVQAAGMFSVTGNSIKTDTGACIYLKKWANNSEIYSGSIVTGNICNGGEYGIELVGNSFNIPRIGGAFITGNKCRKNSSGVSIKIADCWTNCWVTGNMCNGTIEDNGSGNVISAGLNSVV